MIYSQRINYDITNHISVCACGQTGPLIKKHIISIEDYGNAYGMCMMCGHIIPSNALTVNSMSITQFSLNGSFILPNGIIVLVDEDIEAYLNGTLVFYNKDELPEVA